MNVRRGIGRILVALSALYWLGGAALIASGEGTVSRGTLFVALVFYYAVMAGMVFTLRWIARGFRGPA